jgi:uncharacterized protein (TIGR04255 family)
VLAGRATRAAIPVLSRARPYSGRVAASPPDIVSFGSPPVAEVVTSIRFAPISIDIYLSLGLLRDESWIDEFPKLERQARYEMPTEVFGGHRPPTFEFGLQAIPSLPRLWFVSDDGAELLQVQDNWFAANWRRRFAPGINGEGVDYDRWKARREAFARHWTTLAEWIISHGGSAAPDQYEVTYINHIVPIMGVWSSHSDISGVLPAVQAPSSPGTLPEQVIWNSRSLVPPADGMPEARLHISATPAFAPPGKATPETEPVPVIVLELTVRGEPPKSGDLMSVLDRGRKVIVEAFLAVTSDKARQAWEQK